MFAVAFVYDVLVIFLAFKFLDYNNFTSQIICLGCQVEKKNASSWSSRGDKGKIASISYSPSGWLESADS